MSNTQSAALTRWRRQLLLVALGFGLCQSSMLAQDAQSPSVDSLASDLKDYVGSYGPRHIFLEGDVLHYQRDGMPTAVALEAAGVDSFEVVVPPGAQVRGPGGDHVIPAFVFRRDEAGNVSALALVNPDGSPLGEAAKDEKTRPRARGNSPAQ